MALERARRTRSKPDSLESLRKKARERPEPSPDDIARQERGRDAALREYGALESLRRRVWSGNVVAQGEGIEVQRTERPLERTLRRSLTDLLTASFDSMPDLNPDRTRSPKELEDMEDQHRLGEAHSTDDIRRWGPRLKHRYFEAGNRPDYRPLEAGAPRKRGPWRGPHRRIELASLGATQEDIEKRLGKSTDIDGRAAWPQEDGSVVVFDGYGLGEEPRPMVIAPYGIHTFYSTRGAERMIWHAADRRFVPAASITDADLARLRGRKERRPRETSEPVNTQLRDALHEAIAAFQAAPAAASPEPVPVDEQQEPYAVPSVSERGGVHAVAPEPAEERDAARQRRRQRRSGKRSRREDLDDDE